MPFSNIHAVGSSPACPATSTARLQWSTRSEAVQVVTAPFDITSGGYATTSPALLAEKAVETIKSQIEVQSQVSTDPSNYVDHENRCAALARLSNMNQYDIEFLLELLGLPRFVTLDRAACNSMIRTLREARDDAFGSDA